jgi:hypothetical protein
VRTLYCGPWRLDKESRRLIIERIEREKAEREPMFRGGYPHRAHASVEFGPSSGDARRPFLQGMTLAPGESVSLDFVLPDILPDDVLREAMAGRKQVEIRRGMTYPDGDGRFHTDHDVLVDGVVAARFAIEWTEKPVQP